MKFASKILWILLISLLTVAEYAEADPYAILYLWPSQGGGFVDYEYLDTDYRAVAALGRDDVPNPPNSSYDWVFWDASSVGFKMGVPTQDFASQFTPVGSIQNAIASWDNIDSNVLSITYDGVDINKTNDPNDGINIINPFNPEVTFTFHLEHAASVSVRIYDGLGQQVRVLAEEAVRSAGHYQFVWDGRDQAGQFQASGIYILALSVDGLIESHKLTLMH